MRTKITQQKISKRISAIFALLFFILLPGFSFGQTATHERINLGLYGGATLDFAFDTNFRLFSAVRSPGTLFYSDDTCKTWTQAFPIDSLEYASAQRGWSGGRRVLTNREGWVGVETMEEGGTLTSTVISYDDGDSGTFKTAFDNYLLKQIEPSVSMETPTAIDLTDYWFYVAMNNFLLRTNDTSTLGSHNIVLRMDTVKLADTSWHIEWISAANTPSGFPVLLVVKGTDDDYGRLLKYDGTTFSEIAHPTATFDYYFKEVFSHPLDTSMDTIVVSCKEPNINLIKVFRSLDGGANWTDITPASGTRWPLQNADYSPYWVSSMSKSNGWRLSFPGGAYSVDLGDTWTNNFMEDNATAAHPRNPDIIVASKNKGPQVSLDGGATFMNPHNEGHAAVSITKIAQLRRNTYYVATKAGLGYTVAYHDSTVQGVAQWRPPYGDFPIAGIGGDAGFSAVDIDPADSLHVIAGCDLGFYVTTTGPSGFTLVTPTDWETGTHRDYRVNDIQFITSDTIVAVTGTGSNVWPSLLFDYGNIWVSTDGGSTWTKNHPSDGGVDFEQGNAVAVAYGKTDTVIYVGCGYWDHHFPKVAGQLWKSSDFGATWHYVNAGPHSQASGSVVDSMPIYDLDVYPGTTDTLFFASGQNLDFAFAQSFDGGNNYSYLNHMVPEGAFSAVMVHPDNPDRVSVAARRDLWQYDGATGSTVLVFEGLPGEFVPDLEYGSTIIGTNTGLYKLSETPGSITSIWNGTGNWSDASKWSNGVPFNICDAVIASGQVNLDVDGEVNNIMIKPGATLTIDAGKTVKVNGQFVLMSDASGDASFIDNGTLSVLGNTTVQKYVPKGQWHYLTPPVSKDTADVYEGLSPKYWDEPTKEWVNITNTGDPLLSGKGYAVLAGDSDKGTTIEYTGILNTGDYSPAVTMSGNEADNFGWNFVGNAYPSAFDWEDPSLVKKNIDNTIYSWDGTQYIVYNGTVHVGSSNALPFVPAQEGFFIHAYDANPELTITQASRVHGFLQKPLMASPGIDNLLRLHVEGNGYFDETIILFDDGATNEFDHAYDAYKLYGIKEAPQLYSFNGDNILAMNVQPFDEPVDSIPLGFEAGTSGTFTLWAEGLNSFPIEMIISIKDIETGQTVDLRKDSTYTFTAETNGDSPRFMVYFETKATEVNEFTEMSDKLLVYADDKSVLNLKQVDGKPLNGRMKVYDMFGRLYQTVILNGNPVQQYRLQLPTGIYIVKVIPDETPGIITKKVFVK